MQAPRAEKKPKELIIHDDTRLDNYFWLNQRENPEVIQYLNDENSFTEEILGPTQKLQDKLYKEIVGRIKDDDQSVPYKKNGFWYYTRFEKGGEYPIYCRKRENLQNPEEILLNVNEMAVGHDYYNIGGMSVSPDNTLLAYGEDTLSRRLYTIKIKNLETGDIEEIEIPNTTGSTAWSSDNKMLFFTEKDTRTLRSNKVKVYDVITGKIDLKYEERDETFYCFVYKSKSQKFLLIASSSSTTSEYHYLHADSPLDRFNLFQERIHGMEYGISHYQNKWYILTNWNAQNFRLMETLEIETIRKSWKEVIPHRQETLLEGMEIFENYLFLEERTKGLNELRIIHQQTGEDKYLEFDSQTYSCWTSTNPDFKTEILRFGYTSMVTPSSVYEYNMRTGEKVLLKQQEVVGGYDESQYNSERIYVKVRDGVEVPVSLVYRKDLKTKNNPLLLYAYGSYGHSLDPYFSSVRLSLLDRGFVYAIAHIRGGEDLGRPWYDDGKLLKKKNTFYDYIDVAKYLINNEYTQASHLYAMGGSAGGLLMGAVINFEPQLWNGVIAAVPFVDVVTTMLDDSIPLTTGEYEEWGNPNEKEFYDYIKSYSPYDNIEAKDYPNMLVTTGLHDSQVQYWEPAKWVAKLREMKTDNNILLLHTNMETGHSGASGRFSAHLETAMEYAFLLMLENIKE